MKRRFKNIIGLSANLYKFSDPTELKEKLLSRIKDFESLTNDKIHCIVLQDPITELSYQLNFNKFDPLFLKFIEYVFVNRGRKEVLYIKDKDKLDYEPFTDELFDGTLQLTITNLKE